MQKIGEKIIVILLVIAFIPVLLIGISILKDNKSDENKAKISMYGIEEGKKDIDNTSNTIIDNISNTINKDYSGFLPSDEETNGKPGDSQPIQDLDVCSIKQISYSMENLNKTSVCNQYQDNTCIDKTIYCSIDIYNRDNEVTGFFEVESLFIEDEKTSKEAFDSVNSRFSLPPNSKQIVTTSTNIQSSGEQGLANKDINCLFNTLETPTKEVC